MSGKVYGFTLGSSARVRLAAEGSRRVDAFRGEGAEDLCEARNTDSDGSAHFAGFDTLGPRFPGVDLARVRAAHAALREIDESFASPTIPWASMAWILVELLRLYDARPRPESFQTSSGP